MTELFAEKRPSAIWIKDLAVGKRIEPVKLDVSRRWPAFGASFLSKRRRTHRNPRGGSLISLMALVGHCTSARDGETAFALNGSFNKNA